MSEDAAKAFADNYAAQTEMQRIRQAILWHLIDAKRAIFVDETWQARLDDIAVLRAEYDRLFKASFGA